MPALPGRESRRRGACADRRRGRTGERCCRGRPSPAAIAAWPRLSPSSWCISACRRLVRPAIPPLRTAGEVASAVPACSRMADGLAEVSAGLAVDQQGAVAASFAQGELVHAQHARGRAHRGVGQARISRSNVIRLMELLTGRTAGLQPGRLAPAPPRPGHRAAPSAQAQDLGAPCASSAAVSGSPGSSPRRSRSSRPAKSEDEKAH